MGKLVAKIFGEIAENCSAEIFARTNAQEKPLRQLIIAMVPRIYHLPGVVDTANGKQKRTVSKFWKIDVLVTDLCTLRTSIYVRVLVSGGALQKTGPKMEVGVMRVRERNPKNGSIRELSSYDAICFFQLVS